MTSFDEGCMGSWVSRPALTLACVMTLAGCGGARAGGTGAPGGDAAPASEEAQLNERDAQLEATTFAPDLNVVLLAMTRMPTGIYYRDVEEGTGVPAMPGREVLMTYIAYLPDGSEVDRTAPGARPLAFKVGEGQVIRGWDLGVRGMQTGGTRQIVVPSRYAYGARGSPPKVPANAVMIFLVRLDGVR
jgi:FKBP-type peptidyl-prolyl cis-trans isomerase